MKKIYPFFIFLTETSEQRAAQQHKERLHAVWIAACNRRKREKRLKLFGHKQGTKTTQGEI